MLALLVTFDLGVVSGLDLLYKTKCTDRLCELCEARSVICIG